MCAFSYTSGKIYIPIFCRIISCLPLLFFLLSFCLSCSYISVCSFFLPTPLSDMKSHSYYFYFLPRSLIGINECSDDSLIKSSNSNCAANIRNKRKQANYKELKFSFVVPFNYEHIRKSLQAEPRMCTRVFSSILLLLVSGCFLLGMKKEFSPWNQHFLTHERQPPEASERREGE